MMRDFLSWIASILAVMLIGLGFHEGSLLRILGGGLVALAVLPLVAYGPRHAHRRRRRPHELSFVRVRKIPDR